MTTPTLTPSQSMLMKDNMRDAYDDGFKDGNAATIERCAQVAENFKSDNPYPTVYAAIAAAIRKLKD